ncbi:MAG: hypothetical protein KBD01_03030 [Acidobacteria bacterium]|nr:hypothetical protein [Acidobacteriota bacterium]
MSTITDIGLDNSSYRTVTEASPWADATQGLGRNEFIKLLVAQMENQNPLEPMQDHEFVAQLATFSSLEQLVDLNKRMDLLNSGQDQLVNSQALSLVGRNVLANTDGKFRLREDGAEAIAFELGEAPRAARVDIFDASGQFVTSVALDDVKAGRNEFRWDGIDAENGQQLEPGDYSFRVVTVDGEGREVNAQAYVELEIDGINFGGGTLTLVSGGRTIDFADIWEIQAQ